MLEDIFVFTACTLVIILLVEHVIHKFIQITKELKN